MSCLHVSLRLEAQPDTAEMSVTSASLVLLDLDSKLHICRALYRVFKVSPNIFSSMACSSGSCDCSLAVVGGLRFDGLPMTVGCGRIGLRGEPHGGC